jgi:hypothetical protein
VHNKTLLCPARDRRRPSSGSSGSRMRFGPDPPLPLRAVFSTTRLRAARGRQRCRPCLPSATQKASCGMPWRRGCLRPPGRQWAIEPAPLDRAKAEPLETEACSRRPRLDRDRRLCTLLAHRQALTALRRCHGLLEVEMGTRGARALTLGSSSRGGSSPSTSFALSQRDQPLGHRQLSGRPAPPALLAPPQSLPSSGRTPPSKTLRRLGR